MEKQIIFEYRVSGFYTDTITTQEISILQENAINQQNKWSLSNLFSFQNSKKTKETSRNIPWKICLAPSGNVVAILQTGVLTLFDYDTSNQKFIELPSSYCHFPEKRIMKWSLCSNFLFILASDQSLLILSSNGDVVGRISNLGFASMSPIHEYFPFKLTKQTPISNHFFFHVIFLNGDCFSLHASAREHDENYDIEELCQLKLSKNFAVVVETCSFLSNQNALLLIVKAPSSFGSNYRTYLKYVQFEESVLGPSFKLVDLQSNYLLNQCKEQSDDSLPFKSICQDPSGKCIALLHASGRITALQYETYPSPRVLDIAELRKLDNGESYQRIASIHFLSEGILMSLSESGEVWVNTIEWKETSGNVKSEISDTFLSSKVSIESVPPVLGKSISASIIFDPVSTAKTDSYARVTVLRFVDCWTCQIFTITNVAPHHALETKIREGYFTSAYMLAERIGVNADVVALAEWKFHQSQVEHYFVTGSCHPSDTSPTSIVDIYLTRIHSLKVLLDEILAFSSHSVDLWVSVLLLGIQRTQVYADVILQTTEKNFSDCSQTTLLSCVLTALEESKLPLTAGELSFIVISRRMIVERYLKLMTYSSLRTDEFSFKTYREYLNFCSLITEVSMPDVQLILQYPIRHLAEFLISSQQYASFKKVLCLQPHDLFPSYFDILNHIPVTADPSIYASVIPVPHRLDLPEATSKYQWVVYFNEHGVTSSLPAPELLLHSNFPQNLINDVSMWDVIVTSLCQSDSSFSPPVLYPVNINTVSNADTIYKWIVQRILHMESFGQTSRSITLISQIVDGNNFPDSQQIFFQELFLQLRHFSDLLYHHLCPLTYTFVDWLIVSLDKRMRLVFENFLQMQLNERQLGVTTPNIDFVDVINIYLSSAFNQENETKQLVLYSYMNCDNFIMELAQHSSTLNDYSVSRLHDIIAKVAPNDDWEKYLLHELIQTIQIESVDIIDRERKDLAMENLCRVVDASKPGFSECQKCIKKLTSLLQLVIEACRTYNKLDRCGLDFMWRMIESTPKVQSARRDDQQRELDQIQAALSVGEILSDYFPDSLPSLNALIPTTSAHRHEQHLYRHKFLVGIRSYETCLDLTTNDDLNTLTLGHALILSMCVTIISAPTFEEKLCIKLCNDLNELHRLLYSNISLEWMANLILHILLTERHTAHHFFDIYRDVLFQPTEKSRYFSILETTLDLKPIQTYTIFLNKVRSVINSASSCFADELSEYLELFDSLLTTDILDKCENSEVAAQLLEERYLIHVIQLIRWIDNCDLDIIPLKLRLTPPLLIAQEILRTSPQAYLLTGEGDFQEGKKIDHTSLTPMSIGGVNVYHEPTLEGDSLMRQYLSKHKVLSGKHFIDTFSVLSKSILLSLYLKVIQSALLIGNLFDAIDLILDLLNQNNLQYCSDENLEIVTVVEDIFRELRKFVEESNGVDCSLVQRLQCTILNSFIANCPKNGLKLSSSTLKIDTLVSAGAEQNFLNLAKAEIWRAIGEILYKPCHFEAIGNPMCSVTEIVSIPSTFGTTSSVVGFLLLVPEENLVNELFDTILRELKSKIAKSVKSGGKRQLDGTSVVPQDIFVTQLEAKGFHRNSALRAVSATKNESLEAALKWAIEHSNDPDFVEPVIVTSSSAIGVLRQEKATEMSIENLNRSIELVSSIRQTYLRAINASITLTENTEISEVNSPDCGVVESSSVPTPILALASYSPPHSRALDELSTNTACISNIEKILAAGDSYLRSGVDVGSMAQSVVYWDDKDFDDDKRGTIEQDFLSYLTDLSVKSDAPISLISDILISLPPYFLGKLFDLAVTKLEDQDLSRLLPSTVDSCLQSFEDLLLESNFVDKITRIFAEARILSVFSADLQKIPGELLPPLFPSLQSCPLRFFKILRLSYIRTDGANSEGLLRIKGLALDFFTHVIATQQTTDCLDPSIHEIKSILQDELATIKRINRLQSSGVNMKIILQSSELLPSRFFSGGSLYTRDMALKEISRHLTHENIQQWNRTLGRLLDSGLSELGLHFCLNQLSTLSDTLKSDNNSQEIDQDFYIIEFVKNVSPIVLKLRAEHFHLFVLYLSALPYTSDDSTAHLHIEETLYPLKFDPSVVKQILHTFAQILPKETIGLKEVSKDKSSKLKSIVKKDTDREESNPSDATPNQFLDSVLTYVTLFVILPPDFHDCIRNAYAAPMFLKESCVDLLMSQHVTPSMVSTTVPTYLRHCLSRGTQFPSKEVLEMTKMKLLQLPDFHKSEWDLTNNKINLFLQITGVEKDILADFFESLLVIDMVSSRPFQETRQIFVGRSLAVQSLLKYISPPSDTYLQQIDNYFQTNIFLLSEEVINILEQENNLTLPYQMQMFASNSLRELFLVIKHGLIDCYSSIPNVSSRVMILVHLLRIWERRTNQFQDSLKYFFSWWAHISEKENISMPVSICSNHSDMFMLVLELCASHHLEEMFLDILVLDFLQLSPQGQHSSEFELSQVKILSLAKFLRKPFAAWVRLYLSAYFHGISSVEFKNESSSYLNLLEELEIYNDPFSISLIFLLRVPPSLYRERQGLYTKMILTSLEWLDRRINTSLNSSQISISSQWDNLIVYRYFNDLNGPTIHHLPKSLSPISIVNILIEANYLIDASVLHWKILQLPQHAYRDDIAYDLLKNSYPNIIPYYFFNLPEVNSHEWGW